MNQELLQRFQSIPAVADAAAGKVTFWINPNRVSGGEKEITAVTPAMIEDARARLDRFASYIARVFPETRENGGLIESPLAAIPGMRDFLNAEYNSAISGSLFLKKDSDLPIAGSIKARGGIYEVLKHAETLAMQAGMLSESDDYAVLAEPRFQEFFRQYTVQVGSTGNLGMSIGIMSAKLGFRVIVHMSADAKQWKKDLLRSHGVDVREYTADYCAAVEEGRKNSDADPMSYFVDDENSADLFLGYSVAGKRLANQLKARNITVDADHPLFVYLPCGIGGAPGGVAYGLKVEFGDAVHCFFTEPTQACCMLLGMATGLHDGVCVQDFGISGKTEADGLAVGRPSAFVGRVVSSLVSGIATIQDATLYDLMRGLLRTEDTFIEPSSCAAFAALLQPSVMAQYLKANALEDKASSITHIAWATGGRLVPAATRDAYLKMGL